LGEAAGKARIQRGRSPKALITGVRERWGGTSQKSKANGPGQDHTGGKEEGLSLKGGGNSEVGKLAAKQSKFKKKGWGP